MNFTVPIFQLFQLTLEIAPRQAGVVWFGTVVVTLVECDCSEFVDGAHYLTLLIMLLQ